MTSKRKTRPELKVLFDTSILFTQVAYDLTKPDVRQLIEKHSSHPDLALRWYLPRVVVGERQYQMRQRALKLLPSLEKLERLLGHKLNITPDILATRVEAATNDQIENMSITVLDLDTNAVDWPTVITRAVRREPPFNAGDTEAGFRDCLIAQTFFQLVRDSPTTPGHCRLAVVTSDKRLAEYVREGTNEAKNVRVLVSVDDLESLINTLVAEVTEEFVSDIKSRVQAFFFEKTKESGLYYSEGLRNRLRETFGDELGAVSNEGEHRENGTWRIGAPVFNRKERQRTYWITTIAVDAKLFEYQRPTVPTSSELTMLPDFSGMPSGIGSTLADFGQVPSGIHWQEVLTGSPQRREKQEIKTGRTKFQVHWSVNITSAGRLVSPRIEELELIGTEWDGAKHL